MSATSSVPTGSAPNTSSTHSPLEQFLQDYVQSRGGVWDEIEPQVYDVLLPDGFDSGADAREVDVLQLVFDPEALPEHPAAQLASFGTPIVERFFQNAIEQGRFVELFVRGLNLTPFDVAARARRMLKLGVGLIAQALGVRAQQFAQAVFWFEASFICDQKEQQLVPVGIDLHYGREVRHLDQLLDEARLADSPLQPLPDAQRISVGSAYQSARTQALRTVAALANTRSRDVGEHVNRQIVRMTEYYGDLRQELEEQRIRAKKETDLQRLESRITGLAREERLRIAELRQKSALQVRLRLLNILLIRQPKLVIRLQVSGRNVPAATCELVWNPLIEALEAYACPVCGKSTFELEVTAEGVVICPDCLSTNLTAQRHASNKIRRKS